MPSDPTELDDEPSTLLESFWTDAAADLELSQREHCHQLRWTAVREWVEAGEVFLLDRVDDTDRERMTPYCVELIPAERIDPTFNRAESKDENRITNGIEFGAFDKRVAYHVTVTGGAASWVSLG